MILCESKMTSVEPRFSVGSLVKIKGGVDDSQIPESRIGLIIKVDDCDEIIIVRFPNGHDLSFNEYWLEVVSSV